MPWTSNVTDIGSARLARRNAQNLLVKIMWSWCLGTRTKCLQFVSKRTLALTLALAHALTISPAFTLALAHFHPHFQFHLHLRLHLHAEAQTKTGPD